MRSLTRTHPDTHYCHKIRKNVREHIMAIVKACSTDPFYDADMIAAEFSIDDKAKVKIGNYDHPASTQAKPNKKAIVKAGTTLAAADHDTGVIANAVPAVQLRMKLLGNLSESRCQGKVTVFLRDGVFDGSDPWKHAVRPYF